MKDEKIKQQPGPQQGNIHEDLDKRQGNPEKAGSTLEENKPEKLEGQRPQPGHRKDYGGEEVNDTAGNP